MVRIFSGFIFLCLSLPSYPQFSYGDGSETCDWSTTQDFSQRIFNCESVTIASLQTITFSGATDYIIIRSQGDVIIDGTLDVSGVSTTGGPGGADNGETKFGSEGGDGTGGSNGSGGGGAGGRYSDTTLPGSGDPGDNTFLGGTAGLGGSIAGASYYPESNFENEFTGGSPGGNGGNGFDSTNTEIGGLGGAGGGAIIIIAKGEIIITGSLLANGGDGGDGTDSNSGQAGAGGGGGGSGGAIYLISGVGVNITGTVSADGGALGSGSSGGLIFDPGGNGGVGGSGRIRIDTPTGAFTGSAPSPAPYEATTATNILDPLATASRDAFESDIEYGCSYKEKLDILSFLFSTGLGVALVIILLQIPMGLRRPQS